MNPYQIGAWAGAGLTGFVSGAAQGIAQGVETGVAQAIDFASLLSGDEPQEVPPSSDSANAEFEGLNDRHRLAAEQRTRIREALAALAERLSQWTGGQDVEVSVGLGGQFEVRGNSEIRSGLEQTLATDPSWNEAWETLRTSLAELQSLGADSLATAPVLDERSTDSFALPAAPVDPSSLDLVLRQRDQQLQVVIN